MRIITRNEWGAKYGDGIDGALNPATELWLHHSVTLAPDMVLPRDDDYEAIRRIEQIGKERFGIAYGFPYTFGVTPAGLVFEGHNVRQMGAHTANHNRQGRAIVLVGNYSQQRPTTEQERSIAELITHGHNAGWWTVRALTGGHRDTKATECPGNYAYARIGAINALASATPSPVVPIVITPEGDAMFNVFAHKVAGDSESHYSHAALVFESGRVVDISTDTIARGSVQALITAGKPIELVKCNESTWNALLA